MSVVVIVLTHNGRDRVDTCLSSLQHQSYLNFRVILVDNGSTDGTGEYVQTKYPWVNVIRSDKNLGCAGGRNLGIQHSQENCIVFLDDDSEADPRWLEELIKYSNDFEIVGGKLLFTDRMRINAAGTYTDMLGLSWNRGIGEIDRGQYDRVEEVLRVVGANMLIRRNVLEQVGLFDPDYFIYADEEEFCWRARLMKFNVVYTPFALVYHKWRSSPTGHLHSLIYLVERNRFLTVLKCYSIRTLLQLLPIYVLLKILTLPWLAVHGASNEYLGMIKAFLWNVKNLSKTWKKRALIQSRRKIEDKEIQRLMVKSFAEILFAIGRVHHPIISKIKK